MSRARSARIRALNKDRLVLNVLALLIRARRAEDAYRFLERLSVSSRRRIEQAMRGYRFTDESAQHVFNLDVVTAMLNSGDHRYEPLIPKQRSVVRQLQWLPVFSGAMIGVGVAVTLLHWKVTGAFVGVAGLGGLLATYAPAFPKGLNRTFFETVAQASDLMETAHAEDTSISLWALYSALTASIREERRAKRAARAARMADPNDAIHTRMDVDAARERVARAVEEAPSAHAATDLMSIEDRVAMLDEHRERLQGRIDRQEGVALATKAVVEDFQRVAHESDPVRLTQSGGKTAGSPLIAYSLTRALGTLMHNKPYLIKNGIKPATVDTLSDDYVKTLRTTYAHLVQDKRYAMSYHMLAQGFSEWDLNVFRAIERCLKNNNPDAAEDLIDLERVLGGYNMEHCIKSLPLMMLSIQGYALSLDMKSKQFPDNTTYATMATDVKRILKNLQQQIPEDVYLKSMELVQASAAA